MRLPSVPNLRPSGPVGASPIRLPVPGASRVADAGVSDPWAALRAVGAGAAGGPGGLASNLFGTDGGRGLLGKMGMGGGGGNGGGGGYDPGPVPELAGYQGYDAGKHTLSYGDNTVSRFDSSGLDALKTRATQTGPSTWLDMANKQQGLEEMTGLNQANRGAATAGASARANLAMRGGLRGGAAERLAGQSSEQALLAGQDVRNQGALTRAGLGVQDEGFKMDMLKQLPGAQLASANYHSGVDQFNKLGQLNASQFNIQNQLGDLAGQNAHNQYRYGEQMKGYGAGKTADAIAKGGSSPWWKF